MGIRKRVKKLILPIIGRNQPQPERPRAKAAPVRTYTPPPEPQSPRGDADPKEWIGEHVAKHPVVLFMKGSPSSPSCGFSANASAILRGYDVPLAHVDVLIDPEVREVVKEFSSWPTIPQIYVGGEFVGGSDILKEMHENGELKSLLASLPKAEAAPPE